MQTQPIFQKHAVAFATSYGKPSLAFVKGAHTDN